MRRKLIFVLGIIFFLVGVVRSEDDSNMLDFIQNGVDYNIQRINTVSTEFYTKIGNKGVNINGKWYFRKKNDQVLEAERSFGENSSEKRKFKVVDTNDCKKSLHYGSNGEIQGMILSDAPSEFAYTNPSFLFLEIFRTNIIDVLKNQSSKYMGKEIIDGQECYIITGQIEADRRYKVWIAPERDFRPLKIELYYGKEGGKGSFMVSIHNIKLENIDGIWFPVYAEKTPIGVKDAVSVTLRISEVELNKPIPNDVFDIQFSPGTKVIDELLQTFECVECGVPE